MKSFVLIDYIHLDILGVRRRKWYIMPNENSQAESAEKKKREVEVRDLKPKTDPKGGAKDEKKDGERASGRKSEADFMKGLD
jgi:hypothetical protein